MMAFLVKHRCTVRVYMYRYQRKRVREQNPPTVLPFKTSPPPHPPAHHVAHPKSVRTPKWSIINNYIQNYPITPPLSRAFMPLHFPPPKRKDLHVPRFCHTSSSSRSAALAASLLLSRETKRWSCVFKEHAANRNMRTNSNNKVLLVGCLL